MSAPTHAIVVPYRPGDPRRDAIWMYLESRWLDAGFVPYTGNNEDERFGAAESRNLAAAEAGNWDAALFIDADVMIDPRQVRAALDLAIETGTYVAACDDIHYLSERMTERVLGGYEPAELDAEESAATWLAAFAIRRDRWDETGGFDVSRFQGVGGEDVSFFHCANALFGNDRIPGGCFHLYHDPREGRWT